MSALHVRRTQPAMLRTVLASSAVALSGFCGAAWLTEGFEVWTAEGARRRSVVQAPVAAPHAVLLGAGISGVSLPGLLSQPGRVTIASFIYTRCPSACLALGSGFQQLQQAIDSPTAIHADAGGAGGVRLLSISFDPAHDDADQLDRYARLWGADPRHWRAVTVPDTGQLQRLLKAWQVVVIPDGLGGLEHNAALLVIDERGRLVRIFDDSQGEAALAFARSLLRPRSGGVML